MKNIKANAELVWKQLEDHLAPRLRLSVIERAVYAHLLLHSRIEGKLRVQFSIMGVARKVRISTSPVRRAVRRLIAHEALRIVQRTKTGHVVEVRLPDEIPAAGLNRFALRTEANEANHGTRGPMNLETVDFLQNKMLRNAIHAREREKCFYCLRGTPPSIQCLDHVVPQAQQGCNSYRNLVSCCIQCNSQKGEMPAEDFLRSLYREGRLNTSELAARLHALDALACGKLRPSLP